LSSAINAKYSEFQTRVTKLGHVQRAGDPTAFDRALACAFGAKAVELLKEGKTDVMVALNGDKLDTYPLVEVVAEGTTMLNKDSVYVRAAIEMGMYVGEVK
jgi:6-phosphofructokinase 1